MKIALVHDHLTQNGGAEQVLQAMTDVFHDSPIFTMAHNKKIMGESFANKDIRTSFIEKLPLGVKRFEWYLMFMPAATESYDLSDYDVVLSSASAFSKGVITKPDTLHICYCHTPTRYLWTDSINYINELRQNRLIKKTLPLVLTRLRQWDRLAAERVNLFIANSKEVQKRIKKYYRRDSVVLYPPVDTHKFTVRSHPDDYFLTGGRLVPYKKFDLTIQTFNRLGLKLKIFGTGPLFDELKKMAKPNIEFLGNIDERTKIELYEKCLAFIHPQIEDFGITAVEAMAAGRPVIAYNRGGALETVIDGVTGKFFDEQNWETLTDTLLRFNHADYNPATIRQHALQFDSSIFKEKLQHIVTNAWDKFVVQNGE